MAGRKPKKGLDWFPLRTNVFTDPKIMDIIQKGDADAWTVFTSVLILTYNEGYYSDREAIVRAIAWIFRGLSIDRIEECLDMLVDAGLLDRSAYEKGALTSHGIQAHYETAGKRRVDNEDTKYWIKSADNNSISESNNSISDDMNANKGVFMHAEIQHNRAEQRIAENRIAENSRAEQRRGNASDSSDSFHSSFSDDYSDDLITRLKGAGVDIKQNTLRVINRWISDYDRRSIDEAVDTAIQKKARNIVGYTDTVLRKWSLGDGSPKWIEREEQELAREKEEYMRPGALVGKF